MRTSLIETRQIEGLILRKGKAEDRICLEAKILLDPQFASKVAFQEMAYQAVQAYGRKQVQAEIKNLDLALFSQSQYRGFRQRILSIFKKR